jgi:alpha-1,3-rhamnosyl/mannosyltransferase
MLNDVNGPNGFLKVDAAAETALVLHGAEVVIAGEALRPPRSGIGQYTLALLEAIMDISPASGQWKVFDGQRLTPLSHLLQGFHRLAPAALPRWASALRAIPGAYPLRHQWRAAAFRRCTRGFALYHEPNFILKPFDGDAVTTVHDLSHLVHPEFHPPERVRFLERWLPKSLERASHVLTVSEFTARELMRLFHLSADNITVTPLAAQRRFRPYSELETLPLLQRLGLRWKGFFLASATLEPRKNHAGLLAAYGRLPKAVRSAFPLVVSGAHGWRNASLKQELERLALAGEVRHLGYLPDADLPRLMSACRAFVFPSFYEGFGLPVIEAQSCGVPVICSNTSALPEVCGPGTSTVDPHDVPALTTAMLQAIEDASLSRVAAETGPRFAANFSWQHTARLTLAAYAKVLRQGGQ